jgi:hypothetical protein
LPGDVEDAVWNDIDKSGVELELRVGSILSSARWGVTFHRYYLDYDETKARELDVIGEQTFELDIPNYQFSFDLQLLIQCKKIPGNSWTFFNHPSDSDRTWIPHLLTVGGFHNRMEFGPYSNDPFNVVILNTKKVDSDSILHREAIMDPKKSNKRRDNAFEASISVAKAWEFHRKETLKAQKQDLEEYVSELLKFGTTDEVRVNLASKRIFDYLNSFQPLIVFEGDLYVASLEPRKLRRANLVRLRVDYRSSNYDINQLGVDVCHVSYLREYLSMWERSIKKFKTIVSKPRKFRYAIPVTKSDYDNSKSWLENMQRRLVDKLAEEVGNKHGTVDSHARDTKWTATCLEALDALSGDLLPPAKQSYLDRLDQLIRDAPSPAWNEEMRQVVLRILDFVGGELPKSDTKLKMKFCLWVEWVVDKTEVFSLSSAKKEPIIFNETKRFSRTVEAYLRDQEFKDYFNQLLNLLLKLKEYDGEFVLNMVKEILSWEDATKFDSTANVIRLDFLKRVNQSAFDRIKAYLTSATKGKKLPEVTNAIRWLNRLDGMGL